VIGNPVYTYLLHSFLHDRLGASTNSVDIGENIALAIGRKGLRDPGNAEEPLFISKNWWSSFRWGWAFLSRLKSNPWSFPDLHWSFVPKNHAFASESRAFV